MKKYVSPIIEIEEVEVNDIMDISQGENELPLLPVIPGKTTSNGKSVPETFSQYFNEQ